MSAQVESRDEMYQRILREVTENRNGQRESISKSLHVVKQLGLANGDLCTAPGMSYESLLLLGSIIESIVHIQKEDYDRHLTVLKESIDSKRLLVSDQTLWQIAEFHFLEAFYQFLGFITDTAVGVNHARSEEDLTHSDTASPAPSISPADKRRSFPDTEAEPKPKLRRKRSSTHQQYTCPFAKCGATLPTLAAVDKHCKKCAHADQLTVLYRCTQCYRSVLSISGTRKHTTCPGHSFTVETVDAQLASTNRAWLTPTGEPPTLNVHCIDGCSFQANVADDIYGHCRDEHSGASPTFSCSMCKKDFRLVRRAWNHCKLMCKEAPFTVKITNGNYEGEAKGPGDVNILNTPHRTVVISSWDVDDSGDVDVEGATSDEEERESIDKEIFVKKEEGTVSGCNEDTVSGYTEYTVIGPEEYEAIKAEEDTVIGAEGDMKSLDDIKSEETI